MNEFLTLRQVAERLNLPHYRIAYAIATHRVPEPALRVANKRVFQHDDVERLAKHFRVRGAAAEAETIPSELSGT